MEQNDLNNEEKTFLKLYKSRQEVKVLTIQNKTLLKQIDELENQVSDLEIQIKKLEQKFDEPFKKAERKDVLRESYLQQFQKQVHTALEKNRKLTKSNRDLVMEIVQLKKKLGIF